MERHFDAELKAVSVLVERMSELTKESLELAIKALVSNLPDIAIKTAQNERLINSLEIEIDHRIADCFALFQPVASDLRFLLAIGKINTEIERIGDHVVNIVQSIESYRTLPSPQNLFCLPEMADAAKLMLSDALSSFFTRDFNLAQRVLDTESRADDYNREMNERVTFMAKNNRDNVEAAFELNRISKNLERIADLSTNIAEEMIFHSQARVVKHRAEDVK